MIKVWSIVFAFFLVSCGEPDLSYRPIKRTAVEQKFQFQLDVPLEYSDTVGLLNLDVTGDDLPETIVKVEHPDFCGSFGCMHGYFTQNGELLLIMFGNFKTVRELKVAYREGIQNLRNRR